MALYQVNAGDRILAADLNQFYNILKGVAASGETVTFVYNAAGVLIFQPSSNPAAGTEFFQIKNNAGTVQSALSSDGRFYAADGAVGTPGLVFESEKTTGLYRIGAGDLGLAILGVKVAEFTATAATISQPLAATLSTAAQTNITSVGSLTSLTVSGSLNATLATAAQPNIVTIGKVNGSGVRTAGDITLGSGGALTDMTSVTTTLTLPTGTSGKVLVMFSGSWNGTTGGGAEFALFADGVNVFATLDTLSSTGGNQQLSMTWLATGLAAGARVFKMQWRTITSNGTLNGGTTSGRTSSITAVEV